MSQLTENSSFLYGSNSPFIFELYSRYLDDPTSVDPSWADFFKEMGDAPDNVRVSSKGASWAERWPQIIGIKEAPEEGAAKKKQAGISDKDAKQIALDAIRTLMMVRVYRVRGHLMADLDPLKMTKIEPHKELLPESWGFTADDLDKEIILDGTLGFENATLGEVLHKLRSVYCGQMTVEYMHLQKAECREWILQNFEKGPMKLPADEKKKIFETLNKAEGFERYLHVKHPGTKRFGLDGGESFMTAIETVIESAAEGGVEDIVIGMAHRGRLNVLANTMDMPLTKIFSAFDIKDPSSNAVEGSGDVKYHLGMSSDRKFGDKTVHLSLTPNPSHLEAVDPVVVGKVRAKQDMVLGDRNKAMGIMVHGDAAFPGQGVVSETMGMSELKGYKTGGTIHIIINNQIGFTTSPQYSRSSPYPSDAAKSVQAPIFHVNGDNPEEVVRASKLAVEYRRLFQSDVVLDIFCFRKYGHNESDEPAFTQPLMYQQIAKHPSVLTQYTQRLVDEGVFGEGESEQLKKAFTDRLDKAFAKKASYVDKAEWLEGTWKGLETGKFNEKAEKTGVSQKLLNEVGAKISAVPEGYAIHRKIIRQLEAKKKTIEAGQSIDWATAEALAFGTLLEEGISVRLSGQDSGRGTFSQRHAVLVDQENGNRMRPLQKCEADGSRFFVYDSPLSEYAVLGFEYGFASADPQSLVLWEAQFGDFANGAQIIIDQFIVAGESKWLRMSGLVMLLPHGYEGQGPEHSSARPERFLQMCAEDNMQVVNLTTPANYYHALRRQVKRKFRKPLIVMTPKSLLRHKLCVSELSEMADKSTFTYVYPEVDMELAAPQNIKRVVLCTGKVYYDLLEYRREHKLRDVAIVRVEQLYPFPAKTLTEILKPYKQAEVIWCQEEPKNQGYWHFVRDAIDDAIESSKIGNGRCVKYIGRSASASTATGSYATHEHEQKTLIQQAIKLKD